MTQLPEGTAGTGVSTSYRWAGYLLGFSIGGFFDGILLHQVLQWHHLLAGLEGAGFENLRLQILADGLFHALMFVIGGAGLWLLWRAKADFPVPRADRLLFSNALIGFGVWHVVDAIMSHWVLGIHRIKMDSEIPLVWDLLWFLAFGVAFIAAGWLMRPKDGDVGRGTCRAPAAIALLAVLLGTGAALPPSDAEGAPIVVVFRPGTTPAEALAATASVDGRLVWSDSSDQVWAIEVPQGAKVSTLYAGGALLVSGSIVPLGCLDWLRRR